MHTTEPVRCPGCDVTASQRRMFTAKGYDIWKCGSCGLGRTEVSSFDPESFYTEGYFSGGISDGYVDYAGSEPVLREQFAREVRFVQRFVPGGRLLDVGCAYGFFLQEAQKSFEVTGIEVSDAAAQHGRDRGLNIITGVADDATLSGVSEVDVVVMLDVIEHLPEPRETVAKLAAKLRPGGAMVITTGDFSTLMARLAGKRWRLMTPPQHLWFFTPASISGIATAAGLKVERLDHPWKLVPLSLIQFQLARMLGFRPSTSGLGSKVGIPANLFDAMRVVLRK
jgi:SAM-dependent methyltransferase